MKRNEIFFQEKRFQLVFGIGRINVAEGLHFFGCCQLVLVPVFPKARLSWKDDEGLFCFERRDDRSHAGVGHDKPCRHEDFVEFCGREEFNGANILEVEFAFVCLGDDFFA